MGKTDQGLETLLGIRALYRDYKDVSAPLPEPVPGAIFNGLEEARVQFLELLGNITPGPDVNLLQRTVGDSGDSSIPGEFLEQTLYRKFGIPIWMSAWMGSIRVPDYAMDRLIKCFEIFPFDKEPKNIAFMLAGSRLWNAWDTLNMKNNSFANESVNQISRAMYAFDIDQAKDIAAEFQTQSRDEKINALYEMIRKTPDWAADENVTKLVRLRTDTRSNSDASTGEINLLYTLLESETRQRA